MAFNTLFFINSVLLGVALSMDAFSISIANTLHEPNMRKFKMIFAAFIYAFFQFAMPMLGWICVHTVLVYFKVFEKFIPWIALILLLYIGGKMIWEGISAKNEESSDEPFSITAGTLIVQGIATSIDALSVGFTIADYSFAAAFVCSIIIAAVTFAICITGIIIGKTAGTKLKLENKAGIAGGLILIAIGIEIFVKGVFFN